MVDVTNPFSTPAVQLGLHCSKKSRHDMVDVTQKLDLMGKMKLCKEMERSKREGTEVSKEFLAIFNNSICLWLDHPKLTKNQ